MTGCALDFTQPIGHHAVDRDGVREYGRLRVVSEGELVLRTFPGDSRQGEAQYVIGFLKNRTRFWIAGGKLSAHPHELRTLPRKEQSYQRTTADAQVKPAPKAAMSMFWPGFSWPASIPSSRVTGMVAELMLP